MFEEPTVQDFSLQLHDVAGAAGKKFGSRISDIKSEMSRNGRLNSGATVMQILDAMDDSFDVAANGMLAELTLSVERTSLPKTELREITENLLRQLSQILSRVAKLQLHGFMNDSSISIVASERFELLFERTERLIRKFAVGLWRSTDQVSGPVTNTVTAGTIIDSVQQATTSSSATVTVNQASVELKHALSAFEQALATSHIDPAEGEIGAELATLKAQLSKQTPSSVVIQEAGKSLRSLTENIVAGAASPHVTTTAKAL